MKQVKTLYLLVIVLSMLSTCSTADQVDNCFTASGAQNHLLSIQVSGEEVPLPNAPYTNVSGLMQAEQDLNLYLDSNDSSSISFAMVYNDQDRNIIVEVYDTELVFEQMVVGANDGVNELVVTFVNCQ